MEKAREPYYQFLYFALLLFSFKSHEWMKPFITNRWVIITIAATIVYLLVKIIKKYLSGWLQKVCERFRIRLVYLYVVTHVIYFLL